MLKNRQELITRRNTCETAAKAENKRILVCQGTGCVAGGSLNVYDTFAELMKKMNVPFSVEMVEEPHGDVVGLKKCGCHGFCEMGVLVRCAPQGWLYTKVKTEDCEEIVKETIVNGRFVDRLGCKQDDQIYQKQEDIPFYKKQHRMVLDLCGHIDATSIKDYLAVGGYKAFEKALFEMTADSIVAEINESKLRGRGGGGFPAGRKWEQVKAHKEPQKYIVCNGDEGDPGAFMDRSIMEGDPHRMLEGMMIAGLACGAAEGYVYVRAEYPLAVERLKIAIKQLEEYGLLGDNILGSGFSFRLHVNRGAGAFVCGEATALTASIEGRRGFPQVKPPRTVDRGLYGLPTVLNNVETYANVPFIIEQGAAAFRKIGTEDSPGTKSFSITGNIKHSGIIEVPMGTKLKEVVFDVGGGTRGTAGFKAVQIGGPSGGCLTKEHLDMPLDFDSLKKIGAMIGSGGLVVMDEDTCMVEVARFFMNFTQNESCGKCIPCREGTRRMLEILERIVGGNGKSEDIDLLLELADTISNAALCGLGKSAANPVVSTIRYFREEYEEHINEKRCRTGTCQKLRRFKIDPALCKGCSKCARNCPVGAITGTLKQPYVIDEIKCIKCGACVDGCPFHAVKEV